MKTSTTTPTAPQTLERRLGPIDGAAVIVSNVIGGGILFFPVLIAASVPDATMFLSLWLVGGALAPGDDAQDARFFAADELPELAFASTAAAAGLTG